MAAVGFPVKLASAASRSQLGNGSLCFIIRAIMSTHPLSPIFQDPEFHPKDQIRKSSPPFLKFHEIVLERWTQIAIRNASSTSTHNKSFLHSPVIHNLSHGLQTESLVIVLDTRSFQAGERAFLRLQICSKAISSSANAPFWPCRTRAPGLELSGPMLLSALLNREGAASLGAVLMQKMELELKGVFNRQEQEAYMALHNSHTDDEEAGRPLIRRWKTNVVTLHNLTMPSSVPEGVYTGVFRDGSKINNSCCPNIGYRFYSSTFAMEFRAARSIKKGEELTSNYNGDIMPPRVERQRYLTEDAKYGFTCTCRSCRSAPDSDRARAYIQRNGKPKKWRLVVWLMSQGQKSVSEDWAVKEGVEMLELIEKEGLELAPQYRDHLSFLAEAYCVMGNVKKAVPWLRKYANVRRMHDGEKERSHEELLATVFSHKRWDWARRVHAVINHVRIA
ncbi:hypothetical protein V5O48_005017 [Marasmius crinis-equi]|uniref:SET domain-containing protein n=1 Tax=Marasmius crinis-equi TaxID=585013 RepID=A0ABR3FNW6_9AGAR